MKKECSIRLLLFGIFITAVLGIMIGFFAGTKRTWNAYESRIALLKEQNETLLARQEQMETEAKTTESLSVVEPYEYVLLEEDGYVAVYLSDKKTLYASTDIRMEKLPEELQQEITEGKFIESEAALYNFLENYSS